MIRLREAESSDQLPLCHVGKKFVLLFLRPVRVDATHDEGGLDGHSGTVAAVDTLDGAGDQAGRDGGGAGAAVALYRSPKEA